MTLALKGKDGKGGPSGPKVGPRPLYRGRREIIATPKNGRIPHLVIQLFDPITLFPL